MEVNSEFRFEFQDTDQALKSVALLKEALKEADWGKIRYSASEKRKMLILY